MLINGTADPINPYEGGIVTLVQSHEFNRAARTRLEQIKDETVRALWEADKTLYAPTAGHRHCGAVRSYRLLPVRAVKLLQITRDALLDLRPWRPPDGPTMFIRGKAELPSPTSSRVEQRLSRLMAASSKRCAATLQKRSGIEILQNSAGSARSP